MNNRSHVGKTAFLWSMSVSQFKGSEIMDCPNCHVLLNPVACRDLSQLKVLKTFFMSTKVFLRMWSGRKCMCMKVSSTYDFLSHSNSSKLYQKLNSVGMLLFGLLRILFHDFPISQFSFFLGGGAMVKQCNRMLQEEDNTLI